MNSNQYSFLQHLISTILIVLSLSFTIYYNYYNWTFRKDILIKNENLTFLQQDNISTNEKKDYFNSAEYKEKIFKAEGLKKKGEIVIQLNGEETQLKYNQTSFIPTNSNTLTEKYFLWTSCLFNFDKSNNFINENKLCK